MSTSKAKSRSGPSLQRHERTRKIVQLTLSDDARAVLKKASASLGESQSALVEMLVLYHLKSKSENKASNIKETDHT